MLCQMAVVWLVAIGACPMEGVPLNTTLPNPVPAMHVSAEDIGLGGLLCAGKRSDGEREKAHGREG